MYIFYFICPSLQYKTRSHCLVSILLIGIMYQNEPVWHSFLCGREKKYIFHIKGGEGKGGISQSAQLLGFSRTTISRVYKEWCEMRKTSSMRQTCGRKCLVDARGQRRMGRLIQADRRETLTEITIRYNRGMQQSICEEDTAHTT